MPGNRAERLGFLAFWVVIVLGCVLGYAIAQSIGLGGAQHSVGTARAREATVPSPRPVSQSVPKLSLASIFGPKAPNLSHLPRAQLRTLIATGDVIPARSVNYKMVTYGDFSYPFRRTAPFLRRGDLTLINLESPLVSGCPVTVEGMQFCGDPRAVQGLTFAGIDVACTANNHIGNYGDAGIRETWAHLAAARIGICGLGRTDIVNVRGLRFAFLAFNTVGERFDYAEARREIRAARSHADVVVVSVHWGREYVPVPMTAPGIADDDPVKVAHWIIDSGADLIIGNHPHHVQGVEIYHGHLITYAHGNFAFDQMFGIADCPGSANFLCSTREGVVGTYTFYRKRLVSVRYRPLLIYDYSQPRWADPAQARVILAGMKAASQTLVRTHR